MARKPKAAALAVEYRPLADLIPYARNSRTHSEAQVAQIAASIREFGFTNPVLVDADGGIIAGHGRVLAARQLDLAEVPTIALGHLTETQRRAYVIADNQLALNAGWDEAALSVELVGLQEEDFDLSLLGFDETFLADLAQSPAETELDSEYTSKIEAPTYTPKDEVPPPVESLFDRTKLDALVTKIDAADIDELSKRFLRMAAHRHVVFDYHSIAEFYCHALPEVQALMEDSALVIIDVNKAIEQGYVELSKRLSDLSAEAAEDDELAEADAEG
jgi:uncharacterized protein (UPF0262 family)